MASPERVLSVFELNEYVRKTLAQDPMLRAMQIRGEVSNMKKYPSGHWYFSLKDEQARINCVMFRQHNYLVGHPPKDGDKVLALGSVSLYTKDGNYQLYVESIRQDGVGELYQRFLALKDKLSEQGLFDASLKKPIPLMPKRVGIITSLAGAVIHDIQTVANRRNSAMLLTLFPVKVQGEGAAEEIVNAIAYFNSAKAADVIIVGRGGGSIEDLWAFNEEKVAMAIANSAIPIVSAVGHETDFTIADFVSDMRAATPSQAAEICVADREEMLWQIATIAGRMKSQARDALYKAQNRLTLSASRLQKMHPSKILMENRQRVASLFGRMEMAFERYYKKQTERVATAGARLYALSPRAVLDRGYALVTKDGQAIWNAGDLMIGEAFSLQMKKGKVEAVAVGIKGENDDESNEKRTPV